MKERLLMLAACVLLGVEMVCSQTTAVRGVVVSEEDGEPVMGASVWVKGTATGTVTDLDGRFAIEQLPATAKTLQVSFVGMLTQDVVIGDGMLRVVLQPGTETLDEVMVVAFGTQKKSSFTGSASVVHADELSKHVSTNVVSALVGTTPGLQLRGDSGAPGSDSGSVKIRGIASLYADTEPLVIVDGSPFDGSLNMIASDDIESVTVLKDAASAALYGACGAAGVILVMTKSGQGKKAQINVDARWGASSRGVSAYETIDDPGAYYETVYGQYYSYYRYGKGQSVEEANANANNTMLSHLAYNIYTIPDGEQLVGTDGKLNPHATLGRSYRTNGETYYLTADNWRDAPYKTALRQEYSINVNGATDKGSFYASLNYLDEDGVIEYYGFKRLTARLKVDYRAKPWLKLGANVGYNNSHQTTCPNVSTSSLPGNLMTFSSRIAPIYPIYVRVLDEEGTPHIRTDANGNPQYDYGVAATNYPGLTRPFQSTGNPLGNNRYNDTSTDSNKFNATFTLDVNFTDWLKLNATSSVDWAHANGSDYENALYGAKVSVNGQVDKSQRDLLRQNHVQTLTCYNRFGEHQVNLLLGHEYYHTKTTYLSAYAQGLFSPDIQEISAAAKVGNASSYTKEYNVEGYFASLQYDLDERYFASASFRRDASSRFAKAHRWGNFWSVGAAWLLSREEFFHAGWVDQLKLKISVGQQGNDNIGSWTYTDIYSLKAASDTRMYATFDRIGNPDITWETTTNANAGVEFSLFGNRLTGGVDFYNKKTTDLIFWVSVPESAGSRGYYTNIGVELSLQGSVVRTRHLDWSLRLNIAHNKDKILKLPMTKTEKLGGFQEDSQWYRVGGSLYSPFYYEYAGVNEEGEATYWMDSQLGEGVVDRPATRRDYATTDISKASKYEQGSNLPDAYGGFGTSLSAYGFDLSLSFDYQIGGRIYDTQYVRLMANCEDGATAGHVLHVDVLKSWSPYNTSSDIPRFQYGDPYTATASTRWLTDASYLNFQSFTVGYTFPKTLVATLGLSKLRLYAMGQNLCLWSARRGLDPRYSYSSVASVNVYSPSRTIMGGIQLTF